MTIEGAINKIHHYQTQKNQQETLKIHSFTQKITLSQTVVDEKNHMKVRLSHTLDTTNIQIGKHRHIKVLDIIHI